MFIFCMLESRFDKVFVNVFPFSALTVVSKCDRESIMLVKGSLQQSQSL